MKHLGIFLRRPIPGQTKTRLARTTGGAAAAEIYSAFLQDLIPRSAAVADRLTLAVAGAVCEAESWLPCIDASHVEVKSQPDGDLGQRIAWFFDECRDNAAPAVLIGSDSPDLPEAVICDAFRRLQDNDIVVGPAADGGFTLIGCRDGAAGLFSDIRWSTPHTLSDLLQNARQLNLKMHCLPLWYDIDRIDDLILFSALQESRPTSAAADCPHTRNAAGRLNVR